MTAWRVRFINESYISKRALGHRKARDRIYPGIHASDAAIILFL
jgi:hypothetical protein